MYKRQFSQINEDIERTGKAIISLGCSFVQGQGAVDDYLYEQYKWEFVRLGLPLQIKLSDSQKKELIERHSDLLYLKPDGDIEFTFMEYKNAFVEVLAKKYFNNEYAAINLGMRGCGNRGTIKDLYMYPEIQWDKVKEFIVIYCPSGMERFDFVNDSWRDHFHFKCMWPHPKDIEEGPRKVLWTGYRDHLDSEKFQVLEQILHMQELLLWCKHHNAKLVVTPAFDKRYDKEYFKTALNCRIERQMNGVVLQQEANKAGDETLKYIESWPWEKMFKPDGTPTLADLMLKQEFPKNWEKEHYFTFMGKGTPNNYLTSCSHPSARGHDVFAQLLHKHLIENVL